MIDFWHISGNAKKIISTILVKKMPICMNKTFPLSFLQLSKTLFFLLKVNSFYGPIYGLVKTETEPFKIWQICYKKGEKNHGTFWHSKKFCHQLAHKNLRWVNKKLIKRQLKMSKKSDEIRISKRSRQKWDESKVSLENNVTN